MSKRAFRSATGRPRVLLSGYYGFGNVGDEAVLAGAARLLREAFPGVVPVALSARPAATEELHDIEARPRWGPASLLAAIRSADLVLSGGGSLLQDRTSVASLLYYLAVLRLARWAGRPTMIFAQGIGPLTQSVSRRLVAGVLRHVDAITVRDQDSANLVRALGVRQPAAVIAADAAFGLAGGMPARRPGGAGAPAVGLAMRAWPGLPDVAARTAALCGLLAQADAEVALVPMQEPNDRRLATAIESCTDALDVIPPHLAPVDLLDRFREFDAVAAMRLHALIFAAIQGTPCVALSYDPKVDAFMQVVGRPQWTLPIGASPPEACARILDAIRDHEPYPPGRLEALRAAARRPARMAAILLARRIRR